MTESIVAPTLENVQVIPPAEKDSFLLRKELRERMVELKGLLLQGETEYRSLSSQMDTLRAAPPSPRTLQSTLDAFLAAHPDMKPEIATRRRSSFSGSLSDQDSQGEELDDSDGYADETIDGIDEENRRTQEERDGVADYLLDVQDEDEDEDGDGDDQQNHDGGRTGPSSGLVPATDDAISASAGEDDSVPPEGHTPDTSTLPRQMLPIPAVPTVTPASPLIPSPAAEQPNAPIHASQGSDKSVVSATPSPPRSSAGQPVTMSETAVDEASASAGGLVDAPPDPTDFTPLFDASASPVASTSTLPIDQAFASSSGRALTAYPTRTGSNSADVSRPALSLGDPRLAGGLDDAEGEIEEGVELEDGEELEQEGLVKLEDLDDVLSPTEADQQRQSTNSKGKQKAETTVDVPMDVNGDEDAEGETDGAGEEEEEVVIPVKQRKGWSRSSMAVQEPTPAKSNKGKGHPKTKMPKPVSDLAGANPSARDGGSEDTDREGSFLDGDDRADSTSQASRQDSMAPSVASTGRSKSKGKTTKQRQDEKAAGLSEADAAEMHEQRKATRQERDRARRERTKGSQKPTEDGEDGEPAVDAEEEPEEKEDDTPAKRTTNKRKVAQSKTKSPAPDADRATKKRREDMSVTPEGRARSSSRQASSRGPSSRPPNSFNRAPSLPLPAPNPRLPAAKFKKQIATLLDGISQHRSSSVFQKPIQEADAPDYFTTVLRPMDLKQIKARIKDGKIGNIDDFERDILLMFTNSMLYNEPTSVIHTMADEMMADAERQIREWRHLQWRLQHEK